MSEPTFVQAVREMRRWQKTYFKTRNGNDLRKAKDWERRVDVLLRKGREGDLFGNVDEWGDAR